jgi:hypothetical protein
MKIRLLRPFQAIKRSLPSSNFYSFFKTEQALQRVNEALDAGVSGELLTPLPLEHVKLGAAKVNSAVKPNWTATDVTDVQYFDVERSLSGSVFRCIYSNRRIPYSDKM